LNRKRGQNLLIERANYGSSRQSQSGGENLVDGFFAQSVHDPINILGLLRCRMRKKELAQKFLNMSSVFGHGSSLFRADAAELPSFNDSMNTPISSGSVQLITRVSNWLRE
jgi:hypothetical protein